MGKSTISLCMIVKDEERLIRQCLASVADFVDEIIIVDTGSTDNTLNICQEFQAKIYHYEWHNHFADARNFSLSKATCDWIICLDADEVLDMTEHTNLISLFSKTHAQRILLPVKMYYGDTLPVEKDHFYTYYQPRIFRNYIGFIFENRIHEMLVLPDAGSDIIDEYVDQSILHYGYIKEIEMSKQKSERNLALLKMESESDPSNPWLSYHLASEYYRTQDYPQAFEYVNEAIYYFLLMQLKPPALLYRLKYAILIETDSIEGAWPGIDKAVQLYPDYVDLLFYKGYILYEKADYKAALQTFEECLALGDFHKSYLTLKGMGSFMAAEYNEKCLDKILSINEQPTKRILYIGWIGFGNLGDELMYDLFKEHVNNMPGNFTVDVVNYVEDYLKNVSTKDFDLIVLGGGSIFSGPNHSIEPYIIQFLYDALHANKQVMIWGTGIDSLSSTAIGKLETGQKVDFNISNDMKEKLAYIFKHSVTSGVRGPLTLAVLKSIGIEEHVEQSGDPGLLMHLPNTHIQQDKQDIIGVNWGTTYNSLYGGNEMKVEEQLVEALQSLIKKGYKIYLYVLWAPDLEASKRIFDTLNNPEMVTLDQTLYDYHGLLPILANFKCTINFKLHASYLSLAAGTPFIALGYRFKVYDFVKSVEMEDFLIPTDTAKISEQLVQLTTHITENEDDIIQHMKHMQALYSEKLRIPFQHNLYL